MTDGQLYLRIARAHGWYDRTEETSGQFIWPAGAVTYLLPYRVPSSDETRRAIGEIPLAELTSVALENTDIFDQQDAARELARLIGIERLASPSRARLDEAIIRAQAMHAPATE